MAIWKWQGVKKDGTRTSGEEDVMNDRELRRILRARGVRPIKIVRPSILDIDLNMILVEKGIIRPFGPLELLSFTKSLYTLTSAGIPIMQTLEILYKQERNPSLKLTIRNILKAVGAGKSLSDAMAVERGFDGLYCNLIRAGETGGVLDKILLKLTVYLEKREKIKSQIKSAMTYPAIVVTVGAIVITVMLVFVVPKFTEMLTQSGQQIPAVTQFVIDASDFLKNYIIHLVVIVFAMITGIKYYIKTEAGRPIWDQFSMSIPLFKDIIIKGNLSSFSRTLATMLTSGVALIDSLEICSKTMDNQIISKDIMKVRKEVGEGKNLADPLSRINYFPEMVSQMVRVGEQTGNLDQMFERISDIFEKTVEDTIGTMTKLIEPLILVVLGGLVGLILIAMYMPIFMSAGGVQ